MYKAIYGILSQIEVKLSLKNAWLLPILYLDTKSTYEDLLSLDSFKLCKDITVLVSITDRKPAYMYLEMCRTYACAIRIVGTVLKSHSKESMG